MSETYCVYRIVHFASGRCYIGQTVDLKRRKKEHFTDLKAGKHHNPYLQSAYQKYGRAAFYFEAIEHDISEANISLREQYWIEYFQSVVNGFNLTPGGDEPSLANCTPCTWNGIEYRSIAAAARACGVNSATMQERVAAGHTCDDDLKTRNTPITWNGVEYPNMTEAANVLGLSYSTLKSRLLRGHKCDADLSDYDDRGKPCVWNGVEYQTVSQAARALGVSTPAMASRVAKGYTSDSDLTSRKRLVIWEDVEYPSIEAAAKATGLNYSTLRTQVQHGKTKRYRVCRIEVDGVIYPSYKAVAEHYNVTVAAVSYWVKAGRARKIEG